MITYVTTNPERLKILDIGHEKLSRCRPGIYGIMVPSTREVRQKLRTELGI